MKKSTAVFLLFALCLCAAGCSAQKTILTKNDESVIFIKDTQKEETTPDTGTNETSEASGTAQDQGKADGESSAEAPEPETSNDGSSDNASERSSQTEIFKPGTKKVSSALKEKYKFSDFSIIESVINNRFPDITQEQFDKMAEYMKITGVRDSPYKLAVAAGLVDPDAPKMTLEKMREIIENAKNNKNLKNYVIVEYESEGKTYEFKHFGSKECYFGVILDEAKKIQPYFDYNGNAYDRSYMLTDEEGNRTGRIVVVFDPASPYIYYEDFSVKEGDKKREILFDLTVQS